MVQFYKLIHTSLPTFLPKPKTYKAKEEQIYPFFHSIHPFALHPLALARNPERRSGRVLAGIAYWKFSREREKVWSRDIDGGERRAESFCSYIRRALISKSEGVLLLPYRDNPPSDTLCHRKTRCPPPMLHSTGCPVTIRPVSDRSSLFRINRSLSLSS